MQNLYHIALKELYLDKIEIIQGYMAHGKESFPCYKKPIDKKDRVDVWRVEEKQTDVNIALHMYKDAVQSKTEQQVLVSNDSDLELAL